ncbi:MAG: multicopper oxidase domain-containing protein [Anaerolineae bacterium]
MNRMKRRTSLIVALVFVLALLVAIPVLAQAVTADLAVTKTVDNATPYDGATIQYTVMATNNGPDAATGASVTDLLPAGVAYVADSGGGAYSSTTGIWDIGPLAVASPVTLTITATVSGPASTVITNTAAVAGAETDPTPANDTASAALTIAASADLAVTKAVDNPAPASGSTIEYTLVATNDGPDAATGVAVTDLLPAGVTYVADSGGGVYSSATGIWDIGPLAVASPVTLIITGTVSGPGGTVITNTAAIVGAVVDLNPANDTASAALTIAATTDLAVTKAVDNPTPISGSTIEYSIVVTNIGPDAATGVAVTDLLPAGVTYVADSGGGVYSSATGIWDIGPLAVGTPASLVITATVDANADGTTILNTATVAGAEFDPDTANNSASVALGVPVSNLCATTGSMTLPDGTNVTIWGYTVGDCTTGLPAQVPGPVIVLNAGATIPVTLHNNLPEATSLLIDEQPMMPDMVGVAPGASKVYTLTVSAPGTYLYEAGLLPNAQHQLAMGLYGALIVRPAAPGQAYDDPSTAFDDEAVLVLSEIDPVLNNSADPAAFDMRDFMPQYYLINGLAYPETVPISTTAGSTVLLRYVNAGLQHHSMALLGLGQMVIGMDGSGLAYPYHVVAESFAPGQTADVLVALPVSTPVGSRFPLYDGDLSLNNDSAVGFGGMLTFLEVGGTPPAPGPDTLGPKTTGVVLNPNPTDGLVSVTVNATVSDVDRGNSTLIAAEYYIDSIGGTATPLAATDGNFDAPTEAVQGTITAADVTALGAGNHIVYVHGQDSAGNWGAFSFAVLQIGQGGPVVYGISLVPNPSNGGVDVALNATADTSTSGGGNIIAAEYSIGAGAAQSMSVNLTAPIASLDAVIPAATIAGLGQGVHTVNVRAQDSFGLWGPYGTIDLLVDTTGPATSGVSAVPNPTTGKQGVNSNVAAVRVTATLSDPLVGGVQSSLMAGEGFIDTVGPDGTGFPLLAQDAVFDSPTEGAYADIPLSTIAMLDEGPHTISVHGKDAAGNWGGTSSVNLLVDKTGPVVSGVTATPNPTNGTADNNTSFTLAAIATDNVTNVVLAEWFDGVDPGLGNGNAFAFAPANPVNLSATIDFVALGWVPGDHTVYVRARDAAGNWGAAASVVVTVVYPNDIFSDGFESGDLTAWNGGTTGTNLSVTAAAAMAGTYGMQAVLTGNTPGYVTDLTPFQDASYHARFYFDPNGTQTGNNASQTIFAGLDGANTTILQVQFRRQNAGGGTYQVQLAVLGAGGTAMTAWVTISNAPHSIEIAWQSGAASTASLSVDGTLYSLTGLDTSAYLLEAVRLGPSAGLSGAASGTMYFDAFVSTRRTVIGP